MSNLLQQLRCAVNHLLLRTTHHEHELPGNALTTSFRTFDGSEASSLLEHGRIVDAWTICHQLQTTYKQVQQREPSVLQQLIALLAFSLAAEGSADGFPGRTLVVTPNGGHHLSTAADDALLAIQGSGVDLTSLPDVGKLLRDAVLKPVDDDEVLCNQDILLRQQPVRSFHSSLGQAVASARDGDRLLLLPGVHRVPPDGLTLDKHLLLCGCHDQGGNGGQGAARSVIEHIGNSPALRVQCSVVVVGVDIDAVGFREAVRLDTGDTDKTSSSGGGSGGSCIDTLSLPRPLFLRCVVKCSGDDGVLVYGNMSPTFKDCTVEACKSGMRLLHGSRSTLQRCCVTAREGPVLAVLANGSACLHDCTLQGSTAAQEGVLATHHAVVRLSRCCILMAPTRTHHPAVELWDTASAELDECTVSEAGGTGPAGTESGCQATGDGGSLDTSPRVCILLWDTATCQVRGGHVAGTAVVAKTAILKHTGCRLTVASGVKPKGGG